MRDYIDVFINGREHRLEGEAVFLPITDYLRYDAGLCGTKVVCAEGDCGACTVMLGRLVEDEIEYKPVNACILYGYQVDPCHIVTVEGLKKDGALNRVQEAMVECHGAQCGYCTPGFVMAMTAIFDKCSEESGSACAERCSEKNIRDGLVGNLCRCTGYEAIVKAGLAVDASALVSFRELFPEENMIERFRELANIRAEIAHEGKMAILPSALSELVEARCGYPGARIVGGGTDLSVQLNKGMIEIETMISIANVDELDYVTGSEQNGREIVEVGARVSLAELESYLLERHCDIDYIFWVFGSPQIRNSGTLAGNIANASPIADTPPYLFVMDAEVIAVGPKGERSIPITEFYSGYKTLTLAKDEVIKAIRFGLPRADETLKLYKISRRQHLDISAFTAAIRLKREGEKIVEAAVAYGGVAATILRMKEVEEFLKGKPYTLETFEEAGRIATDSIKPLSDVRGSSSYRSQLAENIMTKFYYETAREEELACL